MRNIHTNSTQKIDKTFNNRVHSGEVMSLPMKGLILSGGHGTRLRPLTYTSAKQLVPIANKPILFYAIESMVDAGITDIGIVVGVTASEIKKAVGDGSSMGANITYIQQDFPLGLAHCVKIAKPFLNDDSFVMYLGDNMMESSVWSFIGNAMLAEPNADAAILVKEVENPQSFGVVEIDDKTLRPVRLVEKPSEPKSNLAMVGVYYFTSAIHDAIDKIAPSQRNELEITDAIQVMIDDGKTVHCSKLSGWWLDTGKKDPLLECNRIVLDGIGSDIPSKFYDNNAIEGRVIIHQHAYICDSRISGPVVIGANANIQNSYIGPYTSIGNGCRVENSEIENSILLENCTVEDVAPISDSIIGKRAELVKSNKKPQSLKFMVGDDSTLEI